MHAVYRSPPPIASTYRDFFSTLLGEGTERSYGRPLRVVG